MSISSHMQQGYVTENRAVQLSYFVLTQAQTISRLPISGDDSQHVATLNRLMPHKPNAACLAIAALLGACTACDARSDAGGERGRYAAATRHLASEVQRLRLSVDLRKLDFQECQVDLLAKELKHPIIVARRRLVGGSSSNASAASDAVAAQERQCKAMEETLQRERDALSDAEMKLEGLREDHDVAAGSIPARSAAFATAWQTVDPPWARILASPRYRALDEQGKESVRMDYWRRYLSRLIPIGELRRARRQFDELTAKSSL